MKRETRKSYRRRETFIVPEEGLRSRPGPPGPISRTGVAALSPQKAFLLLGGVFGLLFLFITPPFQVPDEFQHFLQAYNLSEGRTRARLIERWGGESLPASLGRFFNTVNPHLATHPENRQDLGDLLDQFQRPLDPERRRILLFPDTARYSAAAYVPQALGILPARLLEVSPPVIFYLGRLANFCCWMGLIYLSLRLMPFFKWVTVFLMLTPMSLFQAASLSADALANGLGLVTIAFFLYLACGPVDRVTFPRLITLIVLGFLLAFTKQIYVLLLGLFFLIPPEKFGSRQRQVGSGLVLLSLGGAALALWYRLYMGLYPPARGDGLVQFSTRDQLHLILEQPWGFGLIIWETIKARLFIWLNTFVGVLGWLDTRLPRIVYYGYFPLLGAVVWLDNRPAVPFPLKARLTAAAVFGITAAGILTVLYLTWNQRGAPIIEGLQGRYLIPIAPLAVLPFYRPRSGPKTRVLVSTLVFCASASILSLTTYALIRRYYLH